MHLDPWQSPADTTEMAQLASRLWPQGPHPGGLGWSMAIGEFASRVVLARAGEQLVGWAGASPGEVAVQVDPSHPDVATHLLGWAVEAEASGMPTVVVWDGDRALADAAAAAGFVPDNRRGVRGSAVGMTRRAQREDPGLPPGYRVRPTGPGEHAARVDVHRAAWRPIDLPWAPAFRPDVTPDQTSRFTPSDYTAVRHTWLYDERLDLVVEAPDGKLAASCLGWWDPATLTAEIEPLGVVARQRRRGLAGALCRAVSNTVAEWGGREVFINTGPRADYPAPAATYARAGFQVVPRGRWLRLQASSDRD